MKNRNKYYKEWRRKNKKHVQDYNKKRRKKTNARKEARRKLTKALGKGKLKGKDVDHKDGNPLNNKRSNLRVVKRYHGHRKSDGKYKTKRKATKRKSKRK